jgi:neutral ceramidase
MQMAELLAGIAEVDITPPVGHRMAGHFYEVLSDGVNDPLKAKALVLEQGDRRFAFAFADVVSLSPNVSRQVRHRFSRIGNVPMANTMVLATHSHTGPLYDDVRRDFFHDKAIAELGEDPYEQVHYPDFLADRLVQALSKAYVQLDSAELAFTSLKAHNLSFNRRYLMRDGTVRFNPGQLNPDIVRPAGPIDPEIANLMISSESERLLGSLTIFACHADTLGGTKYSADYPYYIEQELRDRFGPEFISAFAAGTCGDINHIDVSKESPRKGEEVTERIGRTIGDIILDGLEIGMPLEEPSLDSRSRILDIDLQEVTPSQIERARSNLALLAESNGRFEEVVEAVKTLDLEQRGHIWPVEVQAFRFDDNTALVGLPGEIFADLGLAIKEQSPFDSTMVVTLANDRLSYIPTERAFNEGSYEVTNSRVKPGSGEKLVSAAVELLEDLAA